MLDDLVVKLKKMNSETLSSQFQREQGKPILFDGKIVQPIFKLKLEKYSNFIVISRISSRENPEQGIRIKVERGEIYLDGKKYKEIILWESTSPKSVDIEVISKGQAELKIWNVWRIDTLINAWIGNSGMVVNETSNRCLRFECSDGVDAVDFSNLLFNVSILEK